MKQSDHPAYVVSHFRARKKARKWGTELCFLSVLTVDFDPEG
jgi:hypothetical protein